jgi:hypothetical protein
MLVCLCMHHVSGPEGPHFKGRISSGLKAAAPPLSTALWYANFFIFCVELDLNPFSR